MTSWARKGVRVVCVNDDPALRARMPLDRGRIYTIARVVPAGFGVSFNGAGFFPALVLEEVSNPWDQSYGAFNILRFRPLVAQSDDIAMFKRIAQEGPRELTVEEAFA